MISSKEEADLGVAQMGQAATASAASPPRVLWRRVHVWHQKHTSQPLLAVVVVDVADVESMRSIQLRVSMNIWAIGRGRVQGCMLM